MVAALATAEDEDRRQREAELREAERKEIEARQAEEERAERVAAEELASMAEIARIAQEEATVNSDRRAEKIY